jgi:pre-rRNA-processing protein IPI3
LLSASKDSTIHTWSLPALLSFANTSDVVPLTTFSSHHAEITALVIGHGSSSFNFAASVSKDRTCLVWNYRTNSILRTYLLPGSPCAAALDPADRAIYLGYEDGSVQLLDLYSSSLTTIDAVLAADNPLEPIQPPVASRWSVPDGSSPGAALSVSVSYDGSTVVSGHQSGSILSWDVGRGGSPSNIIQTPLPGPVTNLSFLPVTGWPNNVQSKHRLRINEIVKPKFGAFDVSDAGVVPGTYAFQVQFTSDIKPAESTRTSSFHQALTAATFPTALLDHGLAELSTWGTTSARPHGTGEAVVVDDDYMALDADAGKKPSMEEENAKLRVQLEALQRVQKKSIEKIGQLSEERRALRTAIQAGKKSNGVAEEDSSD